MAETDAALHCFRSGRVSSVTAMVYMADSERAAGLATKHGLDVGLHLNLNQPYDGPAPAALKAVHHQVARFLNRSKYAVLFYHPGLRRQFREVFQSQLQEFIRLYTKPPTHVDGHQHRHLCANVLLDNIIPRGWKVRRNFTFWPHEKGLINRAYRGATDALLRLRYGGTDYFFSLGDAIRHRRLERVLQLARTAQVELMTHPVREEESSFLLGEESGEALKGLRLASYATL